MSSDHLTPKKLFHDSCARSKNTGLETYRTCRAMELHKLSSWVRIYACLAVWLDTLRRNFSLLILLSNRVSTNDIRAMFKHYGVECGRACIVGELARVFAVYGITVDFRHLSLIADAMTASGEFRAFSRLGMSHHSSPLLQMSFETSIKFLTEGVERGAIGKSIFNVDPRVCTYLCSVHEVMHTHTSDTCTQTWTCMYTCHERVSTNNPITDNLRCPAGAIVVGRNTSVGTGMCRPLTALAMKLRS